jgi:hypothetical protein
MKRCLFFVLVGSMVVMASPMSRAEVKVTSARNDAGAATEEFKFKDVPSPSRTDAANKAKLSILAGRRDGNGGEVARLIDGKLPSDDDQPSANFFFAPGTEGGRFVMDLGDAIEVKQVNTYSWHSNTRGPQVYKLYGGDAALADFVAKRESGADLEKAGWKVIASVDTRPKEGQPGGQYGVSISDSGGSIGKYRFLLFEVSRTESATPFGNTFFSEIDVSDGAEHAPPPEPAPLPLDVVKVADKYEIAFDLSQAPELKEWADAQLKPVCAKWYPLIAAERRLHRARALHDRLP